MATEVERLKKEIAALETRRTQFENKLAAAQTRQAEIRGKRNSLLAAIAEGNTGASKTLHSLDTETAESSQSVEAFTVAITTATEQLGKLQNQLEHAVREAAITELENQIAALGPVNNELESSLALVKHATDKIISAAKNVAAELRRLDEDRFGSAFEYKLTALIPEVIHHRLQEMSFPNAERSPSFIERAGVPLRSALAQLRYEALQGKIVPVKGESLYRTIGSMSGLRGLALRSGSLIALTEEEAAPLLASGALELVTEPIEQAA